ncbi:MAG TPA: diguanylate cyclase [Syntrophomonas sp.]|nr:diguanylate cyclase [Syntrophomonas sp.]
MKGKKQMKVLVADDDKLSRLLVKDLVTSMGYEVLEAADGEQAWQVLQEHSPRLVILDWIMPRMDGTELCQRLRLLDDENYYYIILLTGLNSKENIIAGLNAGADDYITKPFIPQELEMRLKAGKRILELQQSLQEALEKQRHMARHDALTGILNRGEIIKMLEKELIRAERQHERLSVIMGDLDHFKQINDTYGHMVGDAVLVETAQRLKDTLRVYDSVGRYGGEEFLLVLPGCALEEAQLLAGRILHAINAQPVRYNNHKIPVTISLGLACNDTPAYAHVEGIVQAADFAMYQAKKNGRNCYAATE